MVLLVMFYLFLYHSQVSHLKGLSSSSPEDEGDTQREDEEDNDENQEEPQGIDFSVLDSDDDLDKT